MKTHDNTARRIREELQANDLETALTNLGVTNKLERQIVIELIRGGR